MCIDIEAVYEKGMLKLPRELPFIEGAKVQITIHPPGRPGVVKHLRMPWTGSSEDLEYLLGPDNHPWAVDE